MHSCTLAEEFDTFPHKVETSKLKSDELIQSFAATPKLRDNYFVNRDSTLFQSATRDKRWDLQSNYNFFQLGPNPAQKIQFRHKTPYF